MPFRRALLATLACAALFAATTRSKTAKPAPPAKTIPEMNIPAVKIWMRTLTLHDKVAQLVVMPVLGEPANVRSAAFRRYSHYIRDLHVGGVIVTGNTTGGGVRNADPYAMAALLDRLQKISRLPLLVGADFERGASMRVNSTTPWPYAMAFAAAKDYDGVAYEAAETARDARALGVSWIFAPVSDVNNNPDNPIINIRSFGENPQEVSRFVEAYIKGAHSDPKNPVLVTAKHFPGHGDTDVDSHLGLARISADRDRIESVELEPFREAIAANVDAIMSAHLAVPALEPVEEPATVSYNILTGVLRDELKFKGIVVTDAMDMQGLAAMFDPGEASVRAILAGADVLLMPKRAEDAINAVVAAVLKGRISRQRIDESCARVLAAKIRLGLNKKRLVNLESIAEVVGSPEAELRAQQVADRALTLVKDNKDSLPLRHPESTCLIVLAESRRSQQGQKLLEDVTTRAPNLTSYWIDPTKSKADLDQLAAKTSTCSQIIVAAYVSVSAYRGNVALAGAYPDFVNELIAGKSPVTLVSLGNPYLIRSFPNAAAYLTTYSPTPTSEDSVAKAMFGEIPIGGHLPVTIPGIAKYGDGIQLPATHPSQKGQ
jgi:beta-N-acetylhexosaminidase